jgi:tRNA dimethylallyltransferase
LVIAVVGATAAGKSALAVDLARSIDGEIVNADSMQLYRGMDIGTAKPAVADRVDPPHHLFDVWEVTEPASVAAYQRLARTVIADVFARGRTPVLVGGSGLYVRAVLDDLEFPGTDAGVRARLEGELATDGAAALHERLTAADPAAAAAILPSNGRRIVRALEVVEISGRPFTATLPRYTYLQNTVQIGIDMPLVDLDRRIAERTEQMFNVGLVEEVRGLITRGLRSGRTASRALGYAQVIALLEGAYDEPLARAEVTRATRRFARRQRSWFRRDPRVHWLPPSSDVGERALALIGR